MSKTMKEALKQREQVPEAKQIIIPEVKQGRFVVRIEGVTDLLCNKMRNESIADIEGKQTGQAKLKKAPRDPEKEWLGTLHEIAPGRYGFPGGGIKKALVAAGFRFADEKGTLLRGVFNIGIGLVEIKGSKPVKQGPDLVVLKQGTTSLAYRGKFPVPWFMDVPVTYLSTMISPAQIVNLFALAGITIGIGAWRPETNGTFGTFTVVGADEGGKREAA